MQAKETLFADLVQGRAQQFQVPLHQRTYSLVDGDRHLFEVPVTALPWQTGPRPAPRRPGARRCRTGSRRQFGSVVEITISLVTVPSSPTTSRTCRKPSRRPSARLAVLSAPTMP